MAATREMTVTADVTELLAWIDRVQSAAIEVSASVEKLRLALIARPIIRPIIKMTTATPR